MKFATLLAAVAAGSIAAPAMAQDRDPAEDFNGPYIAIGGGASLQPNDSGETLLFDADGDGNYGDTVRDANGADVFSPGFCGGRATGTANRGCANDRDGAEYFGRIGRSEEHTSALQSLMRISYALFCLKQKKRKPK